MEEQCSQTIHEKRKGQCSFYSQEDGRGLTRKCAPTDQSQGTRAQDGIHRFHCWDDESDKNAHPLRVKREHIQSMLVLGEFVDPAEFIHWVATWYV